MKAIISLTTTPPRLQYVRPTLNSLLAQGLPVYLWLPRWVERMKCGFDSVPGWITAMGIHAWLVDDLGPATKLLPALKLDADIILTADDDHTYSAEWAKNLLAWSAKMPKAALGYRGRILAKGPLRYIYARTRLILRPKKLTRVDLLTGVHGCLYRRACFKDNVWAEVARWPRNDDIAIGAYLRARGVPLFVIPRGGCKIGATAASPIAALYKANTGAQHLNNAGLKLLFKEPQ